MRVVASSVLAGVLAVLSGAHVATAAPYPTNVCVGAKQQAAAKYCRSVLSALAMFEVRQNATRRDAAIDHAAGRLDGAWAAADTAATGAGVDCGDTTGPASGFRAVVDGAANDLAATINASISLADPTQAQCGRSLLKAAGIKCLKVLKAEGRHIVDPALDAHKVILTAATSAATARFQRIVSRFATCPAATLSTLNDKVNAVSDQAVRNTIVSPTVDDTQFTTYTPTGTISYAGRDFNPICKDSTAYSYFVKRGTNNKLLVYYQGGGACWENLTCSVGICDANVNPAGSDNPNNVHSGFADYANPLNPFRDWNVVFVPYCSCDIHFGDSAHDYAGPLPTIHVEHRGYANSRVVEKFAREHFLEPDQVFVTGSSAGAYGAWFNAPLHERIWPSSSFQVLADAGNGVVTTDFLTNEFPNWNFAGNLPTDIPGLADTLTNGTGIPGYTKIMADYFPETRWAHYATAFDGGTGGQTGFYNVMLNGNDPIAAVSWWNGSCAFNAQMRLQAQDTYTTLSGAGHHNNYRYYIGTGSRHTMWGSNKVYTDTTGGVPLLLDWVNGMLDGTPAWVNVEATNEGLLLPGDVRPGTIPTPPFYQSGPNVVVDCSVTSTTTPPTTTTTSTTSTTTTMPGSPSAAFLE
jgi:hypothetical protein